MALTTSLISFWELGEASGTTRNDSHGTNHLSDHNGVVLNSGAAVFTASSEQYLDHVDNTGLSVSDIDFTLAGWVLFTGSTAGSAYILGQWDDGTNRSSILNLDTGVIYYNISDNGTTNNYATGPAVSVDTWYFFVCGHDAGNNQIFLQINNGTNNTTSWTTGAFDSGAPFAFGAGFAAGVPYKFFNGRLDQVGFWKRMLTTDERTWLYNAGAGRSYAEIVAESVPATTLMGVILM